MNVDKATVFEQIQAALVTKNKAYTERQNDPSSVAKTEKFKEVQSDLREMQDQWWQHKAEVVQRYEDPDNAKFFSSLKTVIAPHKFWLLSTAVFGRHNSDQRPGSSARTMGRTLQESAQQPLHC